MIKLYLFLVGLASTSAFSPVLHSPLQKHLKTTTPLFGIRCENKYYQLEEMEDKENATTELFLKEDGTVKIGETDGPLWDSASGDWKVKPNTDDFTMTIAKKFGAGSKGRDMGEFSFTVTRTYTGEMTYVGESVAITGVMKDGGSTLGDSKDVGFFNMIDGTDIRKEARSDARPGTSGQKDATKVETKNDATGSHKGAEGYLVGQPRGSNDVKPLPFGWEEHWDAAQNRPYYVDSTSGVTQWERPQQQSLQSNMAQQQQPQQSTTSALPAGWEEHFDQAQQRNYYVETATGTSQWERPSDQQAQLQNDAMAAFNSGSVAVGGGSVAVGGGSVAVGGGGALPQGWEEHFDQAQQRPYYYNATQGTTQWERPQ